MRIPRSIILTFVATAMLRASPAPVTIVLPEDYSKSLSIRLNDHVVRNEDVLERLSNAITDPRTPVVVFIPGKVRFDDWDEIRGLLDKIGCLNVRYFVFSSKTQMMTELELPHEAIGFTLKPPPGITKDGREK
jgi:hypothetical protein